MIPFRLDRISDRLLDRVLMIGVVAANIGWMGMLYVGW